MNQKARRNRKLGVIYCHEVLKIEDTSSRFVRGQAGWAERSGRIGRIAHYPLLTPTLALYHTITFIHSPVFLDLVCLHY